MYFYNLTTIVIIKIKEQKIKLKILKIYNIQLFYTIKYLKIKKN